LVIIVKLDLQNCFIYFFDNCFLNYSLEDIGYFVPNIFKDKFESFLLELEKEKRRELLHRVAKASAKDEVGDGAVDDGIR